MRVRYMGKRPLDEVLILLRIHDGGYQEQWTPQGWVPNGSMAWTGIGGDSDWDEISEDELPDIIEGLQSRVDPQFKATLDARAEVIDSLPPRVTVRDRRSRS